MGRCCCCNKEIDLWKSNQLQDGEICDECYNKVCVIDNSLDKLQLSKRTLQEIKNLYVNAHEKETEKVSLPNDTTSGNNENVVEKKVYIEAEPKKKSHPILNFLEIAAICVGL